MLALLLSGAALGFTAGISPGPLLTLVVAESLRGGWQAGVKVALAPLVTDSVLISLALRVLAPMPDWGVGAMSLAGGLLLVWMGWATARESRMEQAATAERGAARPLLKGVAVNLLNPHAILFWVTSGGPILKQGYTTLALAGPALFLLPFFALLVGSKMVIALAVGSRHRLQYGPGYRVALGASGALLALLGCWRIWEGARVLLQ